jgi:Domain of unknown function (DUF3425)
MHPSHSNPYPSATVPKVASPNDSLIAATLGSSNSYHYRPVAPVARSWTPPEPPPFTPSPRDPNVYPDLAGAAAVYNHSNDERLGLGYLLDNEQRQHLNRATNGVPEPPTTISPTAALESVNAGPSWKTLPLNTQPTCPLDALLLNCVEERRSLSKTGTNVDIIGPAYPNFNAIMNPNTSHCSHPLSKVMTDMLRTFPDLSDLPEQVAVVYIMFLVMRWEVEPTRENYERLPSWMMPRPSQLLNAHPAWLDHLPL